MRCMSVYRCLNGFDQEGMLAQSFVTGARAFVRLTVSLISVKTTRRDIASHVRHAIMKKPHIHKQVAQRGGHREYIAKQTQIGHS